MSPGPVHIFVGYGRERSKWKVGPFEECRRGWGNNRVKIGPRRHKKISIRGYNISCQSSSCSSSCLDKHFWKFRLIMTSSNFWPLRVSDPQRLRDNDITLAPVSFKVKKNIFFQNCSHGGIFQNVTLWLFSTCRWSFATTLNLSHHRLVCPIKPARPSPWSPHCSRP